MTEFYSNEKVLNTLDKNGQPPGVVITVSRTRSMGKTFAYGSTLLKMALEEGKQFALICRNINELGSLAQGILAVCADVRYPTLVIREKVKASYSEIWLDNGQGEIHAGFVLPISAHKKIRTISSMFHKVEVLYFDEFQPTDGRYLPNEVKILYDMTTSISRGGGKSRRYVPLWMSSNTVSIGNPYFSAMKLHRYIQSDTKFFRGDGFIYERVENLIIADEHDRSPLARAFNGIEQYSDGEWFTDSKDAVCKKNSDWGMSIYFGTLTIETTQLGMWWFPYSGVLYFDYKIDKNCPRHYRIGDQSTITLANLLKTVPGVVNVYNCGLYRFSTTHIRRLVLDNL